MNVIIPLAGKGSRFTDYGFSSIKYLLPMSTNLETMLEKAILTLSIKEMNIFFIVRNDNEKEYEETVRECSRICKQNNFSYKIIIDSNPLGPASSSYLADIDLDKPLIISNSDQVLDWTKEESDKFYATCEKYDGCVLSYKPEYELILGSIDKHSFLKFDNNNEIIDIKEKIVLSDTAIVGLHYYKKGIFFKEAYEYLVKNDIKAPNGEFYVSLTYYAMLKNNLKVGHHSCKNVFYPVGEPSDYFKYLNYNWKTTKIHDGLILCDNISILSNNNTRTGILEQTNDDLILGFKNDLILGLNNDYLLKISNIPVIPNTNSVDVFSDLFIRGWFIGHFERAIYKTSEFEVGLLRHKKNEKWPYHYHKKSIEFNVLIEGSMTVNNLNIYKNELFIIKQNEIACPIFHEDCIVLCIKMPSVHDDKYII